MDTAAALTASALRYVFAAIAVLVLWLVVSRSVSEYKAVQRVKHSVMQALSPGYLEIVEPAELLGERLPLKRESTVGRAARCDVCIKNVGLAPIHAAIFERKGQVYVSDFGSKSGVLLNGERLGKRDAELKSGDALKMGELTVCIRLSPHGAEPEVENEQI